MGKTYSRSQLMKRNSRSLVMYCVGNYSKASRTQIAQYTGLSRAHVCDVVDELIAEGELIETGSTINGRGRPTTCLEINPNGSCAGGVWLAEDSIEVGIAGAAGNILASDSLIYSGDPNKDIDAIVESLKNCAGQSGKSVDILRGIGVVVAGYVEPNLGLICTTTNDNGYNGIPIAKLLHEKVGIPVYADTDIRAAAVADQWHRAKNERVLYLSFCDGVGTAFVDKRELFGWAGPGVGDIIVDRNGPVCNQCGNRGCLDVLTSNHSFVHSLWPDIDPAQLSPRQLREKVKEGVELAIQGDSRAVAVVSYIAECMGFGISTAVSILDPQIVYVAGTLMDYLPDVLIYRVRREAMLWITPRFRAVEIKPLTQLREFEFQGAFSLVLLNRFRTLDKDINAKLFPYLSKDRMNHALLMSS